MISYIDIDIKGNAIYKNRLMLDIVANNNWERPITLAVVLSITKTTFG
jgi:hypothetical protein